MLGERLVSRGLWMNVGGGAHTNREPERFAGFDYRSEDEKF